MQLVTSSARFGAGPGTSKQRAGTSKHERASRSRRPSSRLSRPWPSPAPPLQPPMFPDQRRTRQLAGSPLPPPFCCCRRVAPQLAATPVQGYVCTSSQCSELPCLLRLHERVLHIALLCRADRFSPSTLSVTMRRVLCAVCPMLRHRQCGCIALRVQFATAYRKRRGGSKRRQTSTSFWRGLYFTVQNAVPLCCVAARARSMSD